MSLCCKKARDQISLCWWSRCRSHVNEYLVMGGHNASWLCFKVMGQLYKSSVWHTCIINISADCFHDHFLLHYNCSLYNFTVLVMAHQSQHTESVSEIRWVREETVARFLLLTSPPTLSTQSYWIPGLFKSPSRTQHEYMWQIWQQLGGLSTSIWIFQPRAAGTTHKLRHHPATGIRCQAGCWTWRCVQ